jgi:hypothetical protein
MKFLKFLLFYTVFIPFLYRFYTVFILFIPGEIYTGTGDDAHEDTGDATGNVNPF